jgi:hypothetical protein
MDWEGAEEIAKRLKMMLPPQILQATQREEDGEDGPQVPPELQAQIDQSAALIEQQKAEIDRLSDDLEDKDEDRRLKQYEIDVKAAIEAAKITAANPDVSVIAAQAAQILAQQWLDMAASTPDVTEEPEEPEMMPDMTETPGEMQPELPMDMPMDMLQPEMLEETPNIPEITGQPPEELLQ